MNRCCLCLGSNQKFPERQIRNALISIKAIPHTIIKNVSSLYWNKAWGLQVQQNFCNAMVEIYTTIPPIDLLQYCQKIEKKQGRVRRKKWGPRTLDIDIILYANRKINTQKLILPHPQADKRDFVQYLFENLKMGSQRKPQKFLIV